MQMAADAGTIGQGCRRSHYGEALELAERRLGGWLAGARRFASLRLRAWGGFPIILSLGACYTSAALLFHMDKEQSRDAPYPCAREVEPVQANGESATRRLAAKLLAWRNARSNARGSFGRFICTLHLSLRRADTRCTLLSTDLMCAGGSPEPVAAMICVYPEPPPRVSMRCSM